MTTDVQPLAADQLPDVAAWEHLGADRWRGRRHEGQPNELWVYLLADGDAFAHAGVDEGVLHGADRAAVEDRLFERLAKALPHPRS